LPGAPGRSTMTVIVKHSKLLTFINEVVETFEPPAA
jgi:hypothetical protein